MTACIERMNNEDAKSSCLGDPRPSHQEQKPQKSHLEFERIGDLCFYSQTSMLLMALMAAPCKNTFLA